MRYFIFYIIICCSSVLYSQVLPMCGTDLVMKRYKENRGTNPQKTQISHININNQSIVDTKIIPLVFHIIHDGHPIGVEENISFAQINDVVNILNEDFNALNLDLDNVIDDYQNIIGNSNIAFRLANLDPYGNCTNGVNRIFSDVTNQANDCIKELIAWDDTKYVNIWVVENIDSNIGAAAYTYLPGTLWGDEVEGIIINHEYVGSIGSSNNTPYRRHTLSHEFGHYFNLNHTWGWGSNGDIENCGYDDDVNDTPNTIGSYSTCNLTQTSCADLDNIQNFMDYSSCTCMFTIGQVNRMQNCLNSSISARNNLWSSSNLLATGLSDNFISEACPPNVEFFISDADRICDFTPIQFINNTEIMGENPIFYWSFIGSDIGFSSDENPTVIYSDPGEYEVTLTVISDSGEASLTKTYTVYSAPMTLYESFENTQFPINSIPNLSWHINGPANESSWARTPISAGPTTGSVRIRSRNFDCYRNHYLYTPTLDLSNFGLGIGEPLKLWFDIAYGQRNNQTEDLLVISYSKDCGATWQVRATWDTDELVTTNSGNVGNNFMPNSTEWLEKSINIQAAAEQSDVIVRFDFSGDRGTYLYIDNVRLEGQWIGVQEQDIKTKYVIKKLDLLGRHNSNSKLKIEIYNDGTTNKKYQVY